MSIDQNIDLDDMVAALHKDVEISRTSALLDLKPIGLQYFADLKEFKAKRRDMVAQREALKQAIKVLDKRIEISLSAIKTLQTPS